MKDWGTSLEQRVREGLSEKDWEQSIRAEGTAHAKALWFCMLLVGNHGISKTVTSLSLSTKGQVRDVPSSFTHQSQRPETRIAIDRRWDKQTVKFNRAMKKEGTGGLNDMGESPEYAE